MAPSPLLAFHRGSQPDHRGRFVADILARDDAWLEQTHDYIQWLFPLREASRVAPWVPTLHADEVAAFRADQNMQRHLRQCFLRMLAFYGLESVGEAVRKGADWEERKRNWFLADTHNNLRITRILRSLTILGAGRQAQALLACLNGLRTTETDCGLGAEAFRFWNDAVDG